MKKQKKFFMFIIFLMIIVINVNVFALDRDSFNGKINGDGTDKIFDAGSGILNLIQWIGAGMAVIATILLAIRYMYSAPGEKAVIKNRLVPWVIGGILIFGAIQIVKFIETVMA